MLNKIVLDLETQKDFSEAGGRNKRHLLRVSVAGMFSYLNDQYQIFMESEIHKLGEILSGADQIIGYNIKQFDFAVLKPYLNFDLREIPTLDLLEELEKKIGHRVGLDTVAQATLGRHKTGKGIEAISLWKSGQIEALKQYCLNDVELTKELYEYGKTHGKLLYQDFFEIREISVDFPDPMPRVNVVRQTSLF